MSRTVCNCMRLLLPILGLWSAVSSDAAPIVAGTDYNPSVAVQTITIRGPVRS
jgi:hypothetical protein